eukprot:6574926-Pyramimonas_sp.AAC.1
MAERSARAAPRCPGRARGGRRRLRQSARRRRSPPPSPICANFGTSPPRASYSPSKRRMRVAGGPRRGSRRRSRESRGRGRKRR